MLTCRTQPKVQRVPGIGHHLQSCKDHQTCNGELELEATLRLRSRVTANDKPAQEFELVAQIVEHCTSSGRPEKRRGYLH